MDLIALILAAHAVTQDSDIARRFESEILPDTHGGGLVHTLSKWAYDILDLFGMQHNPKLALVLYSAIVLAAAIGIGVLCRWLLLSLVRLVVSHVRVPLAVAVARSHFLTRVTALVPPLAYIVFLHLTYLQAAPLTRMLSKLTITYIVFVSVRAATSVWPEYEAIQSEIFEHIAVVLRRFDLCAYEAPSGRDTIAEGYVSAGHPEADLFAAPEPFCRREPDTAQEMPPAVNATDAATAKNVEADAPAQC